MITNPFQHQEPKNHQKKTVPEKRTIISQVEKALKGYTQSFDVELRDKKIHYFNYKNQEEQLSIFSIIL